MLPLIVREIAAAPSAVGIQVVGAWHSWLGLLDTQASMAGARDVLFSLGGHF